MRDCEKNCVAAVHIDIIAKERKCFFSLVCFLFPLSPFHWNFTRTQYWNEFRSSHFILFIYLLVNIPHRYFQISFAFSHLVWSCCYWWWHWCYWCCLPKTTWLKAGESEEERGTDRVLSPMAPLLHFPSFSYIFSFSYFGWLQISFVLFNFVVGWQFEEYYMLWYCWKNEKRENVRVNSRKKRCHPGNYSGRKQGNFTFRQMKMSPRGLPTSYGILIF